MTTIYYVDINASRIGNASRVWQAACDANKADWVKTDEFVLSITVGTSKGPIARAYKLQWRNKTDSPAGAFTDVGTGDIVAGSTLTDGNAVTSGEASGCTGGEPDWQDGEENSGDNILPDSGTYSLADEYYTEFHWNLDPSSAEDSDEYEFQLYDLTESAAVGICLATITMETPVLYTPKQNNWQWFANDAAEPTTSLGAENTKPATGVKTGVKVRLRIQIYETGGGAGTNQDIDCEYSYDESTWYDVGDQAGTNRLWRWADGAATEHTATTTYKLTNSDEHGEYHESTCANTTDVGANKYHEMDLCLEQYDAIPGKTYYFRIILEGAELVLNAAATHPSIDAGTATNWLTGWSRRKYYVIGGSSAGVQTNYQTGVKVYYGSGTDGSEAVYGVTFGKVYCSSNCASDFGDIRVTKNDGDTQIDYYMFESSASSYALIWAEVPSIPTSGDYACIYVYYDKSGSSTTSSGANTAQEGFFDDFEGHADGALPTTGMWNTNDATVQSTTYKNGAKAAYLTKANDYANMPTDDMTSAYTGLGISAWYRKDSNVLRDGYIEISDSGTWRVYVRIANGVHNWWDGDSYEVFVAALSQTTETWERYEWRWVNNDLVVNVDGTDYAGGPAATGSIDRFQFRAGQTSYTGEFYIDDVFFRQIANPEPSYNAWGTEESISAAVVISYNIAHLMKVLAMI